MSPHWIPQLEPWNPVEEFHIYEDRIYKIFRRDFIDTHPKYNGMRVSVRRQQEESDGKWAGFFHITSKEDQYTGERNVDLRRCERIRYPRQTIDHYDNCPQCRYEICDSPLMWKKRKHKRDRVYILIEDERYLVVLEPHPEKGYCMLVTAFYVDNEGYLSDLRDEYEDAKESGDALR